MNGILGLPFFNLDSYIDIEELKSLDLELKKGIAISNWVTGTYRDGIPQGNVFLNMGEAEEVFSLLDKSDPVRIVGDSISEKSSFRKFLKLQLPVYNPCHSIFIKQPESFNKKQFNFKSYWTENAMNFPKFLSFIGRLPFKEFGRVIIFLNDHDSFIPIHKDSKLCTPHKREFLWLRTNLNKNFYIYDYGSKKKHYIDSHAAFFNDCDYHGGDRINRMSFSIRIDGVFTADFRKKTGLIRSDYY